MFTKNEKILKFIKIIQKPELRVLPGQLAFFLFLSVFPIITLIVFFASALSVSTDSIVQFMDTSVPKEIADLLLPYFIGNSVSIQVGFSMIVGFVVASNGAHSIIIASNALYKLDDSSYLNRRVKALFMTVILVFLFLFMLVILAFGNTILDFIFSLGLFQKIKGTIYIVYYILKWTLAIFVVFILVKLLYTMAPDATIKSKYVNIGALFSTISFAVVTTIYSYYVSHFGNYNMIYGGLSAIVILMIFVYILSYILVLGIAINTTYYQVEKA